jgi:hypothetical protein
MPHNRTVWLPIQRGLVNFTPPDTPVSLHRYNYNRSFCYPRRMADSNRNGMLFSSGVIVRGLEP